MGEENKSFEYNYSAKEQAEIKKIRERYEKKEEPEDKMQILRRLDGSVTRKANTASVVVGVIGALILGTGMSLAMTNLSEILGSNAAYAMPVGILIGTGGLALTALAYPVYSFVTRRERERIAPEIIRITDELMK